MAVRGGEIQVEKESVIGQKYPTRSHIKGELFHPHLPISDRTQACPICINKVCTSYRIWETLFHPTTIPRLTPFSTLMLRLYKAFPIRQQTKPKINQFCEDHLVVFTREQVRLMSGSPLLKYPWSISIWRRNSFNNFPFLVDTFF